MKLSICIPTYNRCNILDVTLRRIFDQIEEFELGLQVEVIVSDNCSLDDTPLVVNKYVQFGVKSIRHLENIGPDKNFISLFLAATGDYTWILGDDDGFTGDLLKEVLAVIDATSFDYLYLRKTGQVRVSEPFCDSHTAEELFRSAGINLTFLSSQIIRSSIVKKNVDAALTFSDGMGYFHVFLNSLYDSKVCLMSRQREIYADDSGNTGGYRFYEVWAKRSNDVFSDTRFGANKRMCEKFKCDIFFYMILQILIYKKRYGNRAFRFQDENPRKSMEYHYASQPYKIIFSLYEYLNWPTVLVLHIPVKIFIYGRKKLNGFKP